MQTKEKGFTIIELLVVIAIIGILAGIIIGFLGPSRDKGRDAKRKSEIGTFGRFLSAGCYKSAAISDGAEHDLADVAADIIAGNPEASKYIKTIPIDPKTGTDAQTNYWYRVSADGKHCVLYANLDHGDSPATLTLTEPTPGGGTGVLESSFAGPNGTNKYFQVGY